MWHGYVGIEELNLTAQQRQAIIDAFKAVGPTKAEQPAHFCHWRIRLDGRAAIFEALFEEDHVSAATVKIRLSQILGVDPSLVGQTIMQTQYGPMVTYSRAGDRLRLIQFGGVGCRWSESGDAARAYVKANLAQWEPPP